MRGTVFCLQLPPCLLYMAGLRGSRTGWAMSNTYVTKERWGRLRVEMTRLGLQEADFVEKFILGSGSGGQKLNKTSSCVYLKHVPSGLDVKCQRGRSRDLNRFYARRSLCEQVEERVQGEKSRRQQKIEKIRRQKRRRSRRQKERMLATKHLQSKKKQLRGRVNTED